MFEKIRVRFGKSTNRAEQPANKAKGKAVELKLADKHEPFGGITIERIKQVLGEENFAELQSLYFYMMRDLKIASSILARRQPLLALKYTITSDNTEFVDWLNSHVKLDELINQISSGVYYGVSLTDVQYTVADGKLVPNFKLISPRYLHAHRDKVLKSTREHLYIKQGDKKRFINQLDPDKVVFHKHPIDIGEITDFSLASKLVWYFSLKHLALAHNLQYFDAVATPPLIAKTEGDPDKLIDTLYQLKSASVGVFGKDDVVEYLNVSNKADFLSFIEYIDRQIATLILGNTLSTGEGKKGSYSQSKIHENRQRETLGFDARLIAATLGDYLNRLERLNFANPKGVEFAFDIKVEKDLKELSEVVKNLTDSGYELDPEDVAQQLGFKIVGKRKPMIEGQNNRSLSGVEGSANNSLMPLSPGWSRRENTSAPLSASNQQATQPPSKPHDALDAQPADTRAIEQALLSQVEKALSEANSYDEAYSALLEAYPNFAIDELEAALYKAVANSTLLADVEPE